MGLDLTNGDRTNLKEALLATAEFARNPRGFVGNALGKRLGGVLAHYEGWGQPNSAVASEVLNRVLKADAAAAALAWAIEAGAPGRYAARVRGVCRRMKWRKPRKPRAAGVPEFSGQIGNYEVGEFLGAGGFAVVYRARHIETREEVALKILINPADSLTELTLPNLKHSRILQPLEKPDVTEQGYIYFPLRLMKQSLRNSMKPGVPVDWREAVRLVLEVARALVAAHEGDIIHWDLKPENILLDEAGEAHIADLGLASLLSERNLDRGRAAGTWTYMAPEVFRKYYHADFAYPPELISVDGRADIFSLGVIFYELLTGEHPWGGSENRASRMANLDFKPTSPRQKLPRLSEDLCKVCLDCLADVNARIDNAKTLVERLEKLLPNEFLYLKIMLARFRGIEEKAKSYCALEGEAQIAPAVGTGIYDYDRGLSLLLDRAPKGQREAEQAQQREYSDILTAFFDPKANLRRAVLLGSPGSGKSTTLRRLAQDLASKALADSEAPTPLYVNLRGWTGRESLEAFIAATLERDVTGFGARLHSGRPFVLLLDEWNQIPIQGRAERARSLIAWAGARTEARIVVGCREDDYRGDLNLGFDTLTLKPLTPQRILDTLRQWLPGARDQADGLFWQLAGTPELKPVFAMWQQGGATLEEFFTVAKPNDHQGAYAITSANDDALWLKHIPADHALMKLARNPFMLWMLFSTWWNSPGLRLPRNRGALLHRLVIVLLDRENLWSAAGATPDGERMLRGLGDLGWQTFGANTPGLAEFPRSRALAAFGEDGESLLELALGATILEGSERVYFRHQLIQEYFAARALSGRLEQTPARTLWPPERWWARNNREVAVVLMAGFDPKGCSRVAKWLADAQPEVAAQCIDENGIETVSPELLKGLQTAWAQRLAGAGRDPQPEARAGVGRALGLLNLDRRPGVGLRPDGLPDIDLVQISGGRFLYGEKMQPRNVETFWMSRYPVTNAQYTAFLKAEDGYRIDDWWAGLDADEKDRIPAPPEWSEANCPRETVNWFEAMAFCAWLSHRLTRAQGRKVEIRLPTEWEWERAARGTKGRAFPWGEKYADGPANIHADSHRLGRTSSVGIYPDGAAREPGDPGGRIHDLAGNVWEWCLNRWEPEDNIDPAGRESRVVRGGAWHYNQDYARAVYRNLFNPSNRYDFVGFRVVSSSPIYR